MRMRVLLGGTPVRGPARVTESVAAGDGIEAHGFFEIAQLPFGAADLQSIVAAHGHAGRIVAAILEASQAFENQRHNRLMTDVSDNPAHVVRSSAYLLLGRVFNLKGIFFDH